MNYNLIVLISRFLTKPETHEVPIQSPGLKKRGHWVIKGALVSDFVVVGGVLHKKCTLVRHGSRKTTGEGGGFGTMRTEE